jgi:hypothetical protein
MAQQNKPAAPAPAPAKKGMKNPLDSQIWTLVCGFALLIILVIIIRIAVAAS